MRRAVDAALVAAVVVTHGVADAIVTAYGVLKVGPAVEANPLLAGAASAAYARALEAEPLWSVAVPLLKAMVPAVGLSVLLLLLARQRLSRRRWRVGTLGFAASGAAVVVANLWELATVWLVPLPFL